MAAAAGRRASRPGRRAARCRDDLGERCRKRGIRYVPAVDLEPLEERLVEQAALRRLAVATSRLRTHVVCEAPAGSAGAAARQWGDEP